MRGFTPGSCSGWTGAVSAHPAPVRVLDVTLDEGRSDVVTVAIAPVEVEELGAELEAEAIVEWGSAQGTAHAAVIDVGRGVIFGVSASRVVVSLRCAAAREGLARRSEYRATATLGARAASHAPVRAVRVGAIEAGGSSRQIGIPAFARTVAICRAPQGPVRVRFLIDKPPEISAAEIRRGEERELLVPPGARSFIVTNRAARPLENLRAVFSLAL